MNHKSNPIQERKEAYVTLTEAAEHLRVSSRTVYRWLKKGRLKFFQVGKSTRIPLSELDRFIAENMAGGEKTEGES